MKTAISLPDRLYTDAEKTAKAMGVPRSRLYAIALEEFIKRHKKERITKQLDELYADMKKGNLESMKEMNLQAIRDLTQNDTW